ncbi:glycoside hydrolase family 16 protein [Aspergillus novofumigatus IBT 16806]|uniref:endo-1,3(4)-beta-glucanase n=1 Tax=Aspergillus novofumigatus (strain IBT 16806) TaxID=1392255 RepID=A0A2I1C489_ASPN1|nr:putative endo-1,3(4)-beta-glucanase [Aspergillus novofumigatus IBT 16806]PKX92454.1 putative endo-1,3(4)-beta-glucanase [Aspergillus novofumigatus IBT 16806]
MADTSSFYQGEALYKVEGNPTSHEFQSNKPCKNDSPAQCSCCNPSGWRRAVKILVLVAVLFAVLAGVIVGIVLGTRDTRYPDYLPLDYFLVDEYHPSSFFDHFWHFTDEDPTYGFVEYVDRKQAESLNLIRSTDSSVSIRVDNKTRYAPRGRKSVRLESKKGYDTGLFIFDIIHTPYSCGTWPALWLADTYNWPLNGEIDVLETTNRATEGNVVTLHTDKACSVKGRRKQLGSAQYSTCDDKHGNAGCAVQARPTTYGEEFNENGGGVYAVELREAGIRVWVFPRDSIPDDISNPERRPDPSSWGTALADFPSTHCDIPSHFSNQSIIINIDLCGEMGAQQEDYNDLYDCPATCEEFVARNPQNFSQAYWEFRSFRIYQTM